MSSVKANQLRGQGRVRIRKQLWYTGPTSCVDIADALSLSVPAITVTVNDMLRTGEVIELHNQNAQSGKLGRRARILGVVPEFRYYIGIEMRRDSRHICLTDYCGNVIDFSGESTSFRDYEENINAVGRLANEFLDHISVNREKIRCICLSMPGVVDYERGILNAHSLYGWFNKNVVQDLVARLNWKGTVIVENDGCTRAFGARMLQRTKFDGVKTFAYLFIARGISCPFLSCDTADVGHSVGIGELGHMMILADNAIRSQSIDGHLSSLAGERAIMDFCQQALKDGKASLLKDICGDNYPTIPQILQAQNEGDQDVCAILKKACNYLAVALANVYNFVQPDMIIVDSRLFVNPCNRHELTTDMQHYLLETNKNRREIIYVEPSEEYGANCAAMCAIRYDLEQKDDTDDISHK